LNQVSSERIRALFEGVVSGYGTHRPVLGEAVAQTSGPILELGLGDESTLSLCELSRVAGRDVYSYDHDPGWVERFVHLRGPHHFIAQVPSWDECPIESQMWSVALVDHAPAERRIVDIRRLALRCLVLVVHDAEDPVYGYDAILPLFSYILEYRQFKQHTMLLSNYVDVSRWAVPDALSRLA
jgi:hypothetical protein